MRIAFDKMDSIHFRLGLFLGLNSFSTEAINAVSTDDHLASAMSAFIEFFDGENIPTCVTDRVKELVESHDVYETSTIAKGIESLVLNS